MSRAVIALPGETIVTRLTPPVAHGESLGMYAALLALACGRGVVFGGYLASVGYLVAFGVAGARSSSGRRWLRPSISL